jgi:tetratricopeptide (TPR) repeat protein
VEFDLPDDMGTAGETDTLPQESREAAPAMDSPDFVVNDMFSDLLEEVSALNEQEIAKESFEDHFSLGTAYRDMDLIEEAIKEFQTALRITESSKDFRKQIQCCGMLSTCFLKKSMPRSALRWCQTGLKVEGITQQETMAFRYDMGIAHSMEGNQERALQCFDRIFSIDPGYRDVAQQIDRIRGGQI